MGVSSYMAEGLNGTGFSSSPCQTVPHGGRGVSGWVERVLFSQRQHHGISLWGREVNYTQQPCLNVKIYPCMGVHY